MRVLPSYLFILFQEAFQFCNDEYAQDSSDINGLPCQSEEDKVVCSNSLYSILVRKSCLHVLPMSLILLMFILLFAKIMSMIFYSASIQAKVGSLIISNSTQLLKQSIPYTTNLHHVLPKKMIGLAQLDMDQIKERTKFCVHFFFCFSCSLHPHFLYFSNCTLFSNYAVGCNQRKEGVQEQLSFFFLYQPKMILASLLMGVYLTRLSNEQCSCHLCQVG